MKFELNINFVFFFLLLLVSCNPSYDTGQTPTIAEKPTITSSPKPAPTIDSTGTASPTNSLTQKTEIAFQTRKAKYDQTQEAFRTGLPATLQARNVKCREGFVLEQPLDVLVRSNDQWTLFTCSPVKQKMDDGGTPMVIDYGTRYTQIIKTDLSKIWSIQHDTFDYFNRQDALLRPYRWTADGKYLYLYQAYYPGSSGFPTSAAFITYEHDLYRINLETGFFELILGSGQFCSFALSPDDQYLVYSQEDEPDRIHLKNMESGMEQQVQLYIDVIASGPFAWNPESTEIVFAAAYAKISDDWQDDVSSTSIFVLTPANMNVRTILFKDPRILVPDSYPCKKGYWVDANSICLMSLSHAYKGWDGVFTLNIRSGLVMSAITATTEPVVTSTPTP